MQLFRSRDSLWRAGCLQADSGRQLDGVSSDTLVQLPSGLTEQCVKKQCVLAGSCFEGQMALDLRLSQVCRGVAVMGQDCDYQLGRKRGKRNTKQKKDCLGSNFAQVG
jgi:hypothetical protein